MFELTFTKGIHVWIPPQISELAKIIANFTKFYLTLLVLAIPFILVILWRIIVSVLLRVFFRGRYTLVPAADAFFFSNKLPNTINVNLVLFVNGISDINELRTRILTNISTTDKDWNIPYKRLFHAVGEKFGFFCFEDKRKSFNINHHVRINPNAENTQRIYTEAEMFSIIEITAFQNWSSTQPQWEVLLIPRVQMSETDLICSAIAVNFSHVYMDGISMMNFIRNCVLDQPCPKLNFDSTKHPNSQEHLLIIIVNLIRNTLLYFKVFFIGPHKLLRNLRCSKEQILCEDKSAIFPSYKFMGRTKLYFNMEMMKRVRKTFNCSTQAIFHSAFTGALKKFAKQKNYLIPPEILGALTAVRLPYPNEHPQNRVTLPADLMSIGIEDHVLRLCEINEKLKNMVTPESVLTSASFVYLVGLLPAKLIRAILDSTVKLAYYISNVPGIGGEATAMGKEVPLYFGYGPMTNGFRANVTLVTYNGNFSAGIMVEKSELLNTREDLDQLIEEFENEVQNYVTASSIDTKPPLKIA